MQRISLGLWLAVAGAVASFVSLGTDFYVLNPNSKHPYIADAWIGVPHASDLILASALATTVVVILVATNRAPGRGSVVGGIIAAVGAVALAQLLYRIAVPPFACLNYCTSPSNVSVTIQFGLYLAVIGCAAAFVGGLLHMRSAAARQTELHRWAVANQAGASPLLILAAAASVLMVVIGFTVLPFYSNGFSSGSAQDFTGWLAIPKTADQAVLMAGVVVFLAVSAARRRAPLSPGGIGGVIAVAGLLASVRILYRIVDGPFIDSSHQPGTDFAGSVNSGADVHLSAFIALACAVVVFLCGIGQALNFRRDEGGTAPADPQASAAPASR